MSVVDAGLRKKLREHLKQSEWLWTPIESGGTRSGVPDSYWMHSPTRTSGWIECKQTGGWAVKISPYQINWLVRHAQAGARTAVFVWARGVGSGGPNKSALWIVRGGWADYLARSGLNALPPQAIALRCDGQPANWNWAGIQEYLTRDNFDAATPQ